MDNQDFEVRIPREISDFKEEFYFGFNFRQLISAVVAIGLGILLYVNLNFLNDDLVQYLILIMCLPILAFGFISYNRLNFEKLLLLIIRQNFKFNNPIYYKQDNDLFMITKEFRKEQFNVQKKRKRNKKN